MAKQAIIQKITHWLSELVLSGIVLAVGVYLVQSVPADKQKDIDVLFYKGPASWSVVILGALGMANSMRRALFKKRGA